MLEKNCRRFTAWGGEEGSCIMAAYAEENK